MIFYLLSQLGYLLFMRLTIGFKHLDFRCLVSYQASILIPLVSKVFNPFPVLSEAE